jgi:hypothetical protein
MSITTTLLIDELRRLEEDQGNQNRSESLGRIKDEMTKLLKKAQDSKTKLVAFMALCRSDLRVIGALESSLNRLEQKWRNKTSGEVGNWQIHDDSLDCYELNSVMDAFAHDVVVNSVGRVSVLLKVCSFLSELTGLKKDLKQLESNIQEIDSTKSPGVKEIEMLKHVSESIEKAYSKAKERSKDIALIEFLEKATSDSAYVTLNDLDDHLFKLIKEHGLGDKIKIGLSEQ